MPDFGYVIHHDRQIDFENAERSIFNYVWTSETSLRRCVMCGACTATCSAAQFTNINIRKIMALLRIGAISGVQDEIKQCMLCGKCQLVCPRDVNMRNVILKIHEALGLFKNA